MAKDDVEFSQAVAQLRQAMSFLRALYRLEGPLQAAAGIEGRVKELKVEDTTLSRLIETRKGDLKKLTDEVSAVRKMNLEEISKLTAAFTEKRAALDVAHEEKSRVQEQAHSILAAKNDEIIKEQQEQIDANRRSLADLTTQINAAEKKRDSLAQTFEKQASALR